MSSVVYAIYAPSGECYVGSTGSHAKRWKRHREDLARGNHHSFLLQRAANKYGVERLTFAVLETVLADRATLLEREQYWIDTVQPAYNVSKQANGRVAPLRPDTCAKISEVMKRRWREEPGLREKMKAAVSAAHKGRPGRPISEAHRETLRQWHLGRTVPPETRAKMSAANKGCIHSEAMRRKLSAAKMGHPVSEETRRKISDARRQSPPSVNPRKARQPLTADAVRDIRKRYAQGELLSSLAIAYGASKENLVMVVKRRTWRHVE